MKPRVVGGGQIVLGSDRPVLDAGTPELGATAEVWDQVLSDNAARLLGRVTQPAEPRRGGRPR